MHSSNGVFIPVYPSLRPTELFAAPSEHWKHVFPFNRSSGLWTFSGRVALHAGIQRLGLPPQSTILFPSYFEGAEINTLLASGFKLRFYHVDRNFHAALEDIEKRLDDDISALYVIHYFGIPQRLAPILALCRRHGIALIEDCALSLFSSDHDIPLGASGDMALFSVYKTLPVPHGGFLVSKMGFPNVALHKPPSRSTFFQTADLLVQHIKTQAPGRMLLERLWTTTENLRRTLAKTTVVSGSTEWDPRLLCYSASPIVGRLIQAVKPAEIVRRRRNNFTFLLSMLADTGAPAITELSQGVCPLFFPLLVNERAQFRQALSARGIGSVSFWSKNHSACPEPFVSAAARWRQQLVEIPIHQQLHEEHMERIGHTCAELLNKPCYRTT